MNKVGDFFLRKKKRTKRKKKSNSCERNVEYVVRPGI
ncbi:MAG: hypothetical protein MRERV_25c001 [Mycoplasmataceae bacterium RV_VA103A]|nr:MAG: hypothetical protein MRERV_25c001 [Mycoplasmataceae bacterium RV_VA103A]